MKNPTIIILTIFFLATNARLHAAAPVIIDETLTKKIIGLNLEYLEDKGGLLSFVVEEHGGKIWFVTGDNKGTSFFIEIPSDSIISVNGKTIQ